MPTTTIPVDVAVYSAIIVARPFRPKLDENGVQRQDRKTRLPLNDAQLIIMHEGGADTIIVTIAAEQTPQLQQGQPVSVSGLTATPWVRNGRDGVAYRAVEVRPLAAAKAS